MFERYFYEDVEITNVTLPRGSRVGLVLAAANRDPVLYDNPAAVISTRSPQPHASFGGGLHFCIGAPLARMEMQTGLAALFDRFPQLTLDQPPKFANSYHFHKLDQLMVRP